jgi:RimJ/RimL family protein N-acetyltransferase
MGIVRSKGEGRPQLVGERVTLRAFRPSDAIEREVIGRDPEIRLMYGVGDDSTLYGVGDDSTPFSPKSAQSWYEGERQHPCSWAIEYRDRLVGATRLNISHNDRRARFAIGMYSTEFTGIGLGTEAAILVLGYAFTDLQLHRVDLRVIAYNRRAISSYEKVGFSLEGRERETVLVNGEWHDDLIMSILDWEYRRRYSTGE